MGNFRTFVLDDISFLTFKIASSNLLYISGSKASANKYLIRDLLQTPSFVSIIFPSFLSLKKSFHSSIEDATLVSLKSTS